MPRKLGRPRKTGNLFLIGDVLETHERLRLSGWGRNAAIKQTIVQVKALHPGCRLSETAVKNILAEFQPEKEFSFQVGAPDKWKPGIFRVAKQGKEYTLLFADRPPYQKRGKQFTKRKIRFSPKI